MSRGDYVLLCKPKETPPCISADYRHLRARICGLGGFVGNARNQMCGLCVGANADSCREIAGSSGYESVRFGREFRRFLVEDEFRFVLAPAYSLFVGAAVKKQSGEKIRFVVEDIDDEALKDSLRRAFKNHLDYLHESGGCAEKSAGRPEVSFVAGNRRKIRRYILKKHGEPWKLRVV